MFGGCHTMLSPIYNNRIAVKMASWLLIYGIYIPLQSSISVTNYPMSGTIQ